MVYDPYRTTETVHGRLAAGPTDCSPTVHSWYACRHHEDDSRSDTGWRLCPAKRDRQPCACVLLAAREATVVPHAKGYKRYPQPIGAVDTVHLSLRIRLESSPKQDRPNRLDNYGIFELDHNTSMRAYTFPGILSMFGKPNGTYRRMQW